MVFSNNLLMGAAAAAGAAPAAGYVPNGAVWLDGSADYFTRTQKAGNRKTYTLSIWVKHSKLGSAQMFVSAGATAVDWFKFDSTDALDIGGIEGGARALMSTALYRDPSAWMHVVLAVNTAATVATDRVRAYVNGRQLTDFSTRNNPTLNSESNTSNTVIQNIGNDSYDSSASPFGSYMSEVIMLDGYARPPSDFGTEDANGVWIPKDPTVSVTAYKASNGFWLDFADDTDLGNDVSYSGLSLGTDNSFTATSMAAANWTYDRPADSGTTIGNYATLNALNLGAYSIGYGTLSRGNLAHFGSSAASAQAASTTISNSSGKWYWEVTYTTVAGAYPIAGILKTGTEATTSSANEGVINNVTDGNFFNFGSLITTGWGGISAGTVMMFALDQDNGAFYVGRNGTWETVSSVVGIPDSGASKTGAISTVAALSTPMTPLSIDYNGSKQTCNFGANNGFAYPIGAANDTEGFAPLATQSLPAPTLTKPTDNFLPILYEGNGVGQRVGNFIPFTDSKTVNYSARFDVADSDYLTKTFTATPTTDGDHTCTISFWFKQASDVIELILTAGDTSSLGQSWVQIGTSSQGYGLRVVSETYGADAHLDVSSLRTITDYLWHHYVVDIDTSTAGGRAEADRVKLYIDGVRVTAFSTQPVGDRPLLPAENALVYFGEAEQHNVGASLTPGNYVDGYLSEFVMINGTAYGASSFGETDTSTNRWIPKDVSGLSFGTNGFYLEFGSTSGSDSDLGDDTSGNDNDFTASSGFDTNKANQMYDTPTRNFITWDPASKDSSATLTLGNLKAVGTSGSTADRVDSTIFLPSSGKYYFEGRVDAIPAGQPYPVIGLGVWDSSYNNFPSQTGNGGIDFRADSKVFAYNYVEVADYSSAVTWSVGDVIGVAVDMDTGQVWFSYNGTFQGSGDPGAGTNETYKITPNLTTLMPQFTGYSNGALTANYGSWRYFDGAATTLDTAAGGYFQSTSVPTGFKAIQQDNLVENTAGITGLSWIKNRDSSDDSHNLTDRIRGVYNYLESNDTDNNNVDTNTVQRFLQEGVQIGNAHFINTSGEACVNWQWANNGAETTDSSSVGSIDCTYRANTDAGFSIGTYTGDGSTQTVAHGLGAVPKCIFVKKYSDTGATDRYAWAVYHASEGNTKYGVLDTSAAFGTSSTYWNNTTPISTVFTIGTNNSVGASKDYIFYAWAEVAGYSSFGSWTGNGDADGPFIYCGFKPEFVIHKRSVGEIGNWIMQDAQRNPYNPAGIRLNADNAYSEATVGVQYIDLVANGIKIRNASGGSNTSGHTYIYMAWAENPFGGSGVGQARAR